MSLFVSPVFSHGEYTTAQEPGHQRRKVICSRPPAKLILVDPSLCSGWQTKSAVQSGERNQRI